MQKSVPSNPSETSFPVQQSTEDIPQMTSSIADQYEQPDDRTQDNSRKTVVGQCSSSKRPLPPPSAITRVPVSMHPAVRFSSQSIDIQFGDIQWQDSMPVAVSPLEEISNGSSNNEEEELSSMVNTENQE